MDRYPHEFSGGQRQRVCIARAIAVKPQFIVCDEAVSALDVTIQAQVIDLLIELREKLNLSYLFISHDLSVVKRICDRVVVLNKGMIVEQGSGNDVIEKPVQDYTKRLPRRRPDPGRQAQRDLAQAVNSSPRIYRRDLADNSVHNGSVKIARLFIALVACLLAGCEDETPVEKATARRSSSWATSTNRRAWTRTSLAVSSRATSSAPCSRAW